MSFVKPLAGSLPFLILLSGCSLDPGEGNELLEWIKIFAPMITALGGGWVGVRMGMSRLRSEMAFKSRLEWYQNASERAQEARFSMRDLMRILWNENKSIEEQGAAWDRLCKDVNELSDVFPYSNLYASVTTFNNLYRFSEMTKTLRELENLNGYMAKKEELENRKESFTEEHEKKVADLELKRNELNAKAEITSEDKAEINRCELEIKKLNNKKIVFSEEDKLALDECVAKIKELEENKWYVDKSREDWLNTYGDQIKRVSGLLREDLRWHLGLKSTVRTNNWKHRFSEARAILRAMKDGTND